LQLQRDQFSLTFTVKLSLRIICCKLGGTTHWFKTKISEQLFRATFNAV